MLPPLPQKRRCMTATKLIRLEISFQKLLSIIDQLGPDEKLLLRKKLLKT